MARKKGQLRLMQRALANALKTIARNSGLEPALNEELKKIKLRTNLEFKYGALRKNKSLAKAVGFTDKTHKNGQTIYDDEAWEGTVTRSVRWDPFGFCPPELTKRLKPW